VRDSHAIAAKLEECLEADYFPQAIKGVYALISHILFLEEKVSSLKDTINRLQSECGDKDAWEGRYWALLEEAEASRPRKIRTCGEGLKVGTVVIDSEGDAWQVTKDRIWEVVGGAYDRKPTLDPKWGPYAIIYTPKEES
jgi:hypothetical protein